MEVSEMIKAARLEHGWPDIDMSYDTVIEIFKNDPGTFWQVSENGFLAGQMTKNYLHMWGVNVAVEIVWYVSPEHRTKGEGMELYNKFEQWARDRNCDYILQGRPTKGCRKVSNMYIKELN